ncbi:MAG: hypothetical protein KAS40_10220, partial [Desulfobacterales bacterium]|nr:hypothetical protein [Desulfobacterales bacterium]
MNSDADVRKFSLRLKLTIIFISIAALAVTLTAFATFQKSQQALETEAFRKLTAIREMKAKQIENFFRHIEGQIRLLSEDDSVVSAILKFQKGAEDLAKEMSAEKIIRERLGTYYENEFISRMPLSQTNRDIDRFLPTTPVALSLQKAYIVDNPYDIGAKDYLLSASGLNQYGRAHKQYHPFFKDFVKEFGFYDLFLIDLQ